MVIIALELPLLESLPLCITMLPVDRIVGSIIVAYGDREKKASASALSFPGTTKDHFTYTEAPFFRNRNQNPRHNFFLSFQNAVFVDD